MIEREDEPAGPIALDQGYAWPHAARLLPEPESVAVLFGPSPIPGTSASGRRRRPGERGPLPPPAVGSLPQDGPGVVAPPDTPVPAALPVDIRVEVPVAGPVDVAAAGAAPAGSRRAVAVARHVVRVGAWCIAAACAWMLLWATVPRLFGWHPTLIVGGSMAPSIDRGDVIVVRPVGRDRLGVGAVVTFADRGRAGQLVTHRIVKVLDDGRYQTRGDHNADADPLAVDLAAIRGRAVLRLPLVGRPVVWARDGDWAPLAGLAAAALLVSAALLEPTWPRRRRAATGRSATAFDLLET